MASNIAYITDPATGKTFTWDDLNTDTNQMISAGCHPDYPARLSPSELLAMYNTKNPSSSESVSVSQASDYKYKRYDAHLAGQDMSLEELKMKALRNPPAFETLGPFPIPEVYLAPKPAPAPAEEEGSKDKPIGMYAFTCRVTMSGC